MSSLFSFWCFGEEVFQNAFELSGYTLASKVSPYVAPTIGQITTNAPIIFICTSKVTVPALLSCYQNARDTASVF